MKSASLVDKFGAIAQLGERLRGTQEVGGSIPPGSTNIKDYLLPPRPVDTQMRNDKNFVFVISLNLGHTIYGLIFTKTNRNVFR